MLFKRIIVCVSCLLLPMIASAQGRDAPTIIDIAFDQVIQDTITEEAFYDWYRVMGRAGDRIVVEMQAREGLLPLLGILDPTGDLVTRSEDGGINDTILLEYTIPDAGTYTIVATRVGNADGTSTGAYSLEMRLANPAPLVENEYQEVTFRCQDFEVTTAATVRFAEDRDQDSELVHRITIYGIDGFEPVLRIRFRVADIDYDICETDAQRTIGDSFTLPGEETRTVTEDALHTVAQHTIAGAEEVGIITLTLGSRDGKPGRYMMIIEGFSIHQRADIDLIETGIGPLAARRSVMRVYMVAGPRSRLDPYLAVAYSDQRCDDAGRGDCANVPSFSGAGAVLNEGDAPTTIQGDRNDAGLVLAPGNPDMMVLELSSRAASSTGTYSVFFIGELPAR